MAVVVGFFESRHVQKINAANKFAPAQHLPDEALNAGQRQTALVQSRFGGVNHFKGMQQFEVEGA